MAGAGLRQMLAPTAPAAPVTRRILHVSARFSYQAVNKLTKSFRKGKAVYRFIYGHQWLVVD
jgi:hypothetical protein